MSRLPLLLALALVACDRGPSSAGRSSDPLGSDAPADHPASRPAAPSTHTPTPEQREAPRAAAPFDPARPSVAGVAFTVPAPFSYRRPDVEMRLAEYVVPASAGDDSPAVMTIHHFPGMGGSTDDNLARWLGQLTQPDGRSTDDVARVERATIQGMEVTRVDATGTYTGMTTGSGAPTAARPNQRLLGAIVIAPHGPVFFKVVGPAAVMDRAAPAFEEMLASLTPAL